MIWSWPQVDRSKPFRSENFPALGKVPGAKRITTLVLGARRLCQAQIFLSDKDTRTIEDLHWSSATLSRWTVGRLQ